MCSQGMWCVSTLHGRPSRLPRSKMLSCSLFARHCRCHLTHISAAHMHCKMNHPTRRQAEKKKAREDAKQTQEVVENFQKADLD